jgi:hypothetical protein
MRTLYCYLSIRGTVFYIAVLSYNELFWNRSTRETTPCGLIRNSEAIRTPGSTTKSKTSNSMSSDRRVEASLCRFVPTSVEMEEFFAASEQQAQHTFRERYGFLPSRYYLSTVFSSFCFIMPLREKYGEVCLLVHRCHFQVKNTLAYTELHCYDQV